MAHINSFRDLLVWQKAIGKARQSTAIYTNHLWVAHGSGAELETQLELSARVKVVSEAEAAALIKDTQEIGAHS